MNMRKKLAIAAMILFLCGCISAGSGMCEDNEAKIVTKEDESTAEKVNNSMCPVSDDDIVRDEAVMVEYNGKIYYLCCEACAKHFKKHPGKFAGIMNTR